MRNVNDRDVKFQHEARRDIGVRMKIKGEKGVEHESSVVRDGDPPAASHLMLPPGHAFKVKEFSVSLLWPGNDVSGIGGHYFLIEPGAYDFQCELELPGFSALGAGGKQFTPAADEWTGKLTSREQKVTIVAPDAPVAKKAGANPRADETKLKWGEPVNGLRAALAIRTLPAGPGAADTPDLYLVVQNVSDAPIHLIDTVAAPGLRSLAIHRDDLLQSRYRIDEPTTTDVKLQPREAVSLLMTPRGDAPSKGQMLAANMLKEPHLILDGQLNIETAPDGAWTGKLITGKTGGAAAAGQPPLLPGAKVGALPGQPDGPVSNAPGGQVPEADQEALRRLVRGGKIDTKSLQAMITRVAECGAKDAGFARLVLAEFEKSCAAEPGMNRLNRDLLAVMAGMFETWSAPRWRTQLARLNPNDPSPATTPQPEALGQLETEIFRKA